MKRYRLLRNLRYYHFGASVLAIGVAVVALMWVTQINSTTKENLKLTHCNQGLLALATLDIWNEHNLSQCEPSILEDLRRKYQ